MKKLIFSSVIVCAALAFMLSTSTSTQSLDNMLENVFYDTAIAAQDDERNVEKDCEKSDDKYVICKAGSIDCSPTECIVTSSY